MSANPAAEIAIDGARRQSPVAVALLYNPYAPHVLARVPDAVDLLSITPDVLQVDRRHQGRRSPPAARRFADVEVLVDTVDLLAREWPMVGHGVGLSIGTPGPLDRGYLQRVRSWIDRLGLLWYSDHLAFFRLPRGSTAAHEAGMACPLPLDLGVCDAVARRAARVQAALDVPFLLENGVSYVQPVADDLTEAGFLDRLCARAGIGLVLDLHNLYVNARNHGFDAAAMLEKLDVRAVHEIHVAGGDELLGMFTDAHSGAVPEVVWGLLRRLLPRLVHLRAITFEYHESAGPRLGVDGIRAQLDRVRDELARAGRASGRPPRRRAEVARVA